MGCQHHLRHVQGGKHVTLVVAQVVLPPCPLKKGCTKTPNSTMKPRMVTVLFCYFQCFVIIIVVVVVIIIIISIIIINVLLLILFCTFCTFVLVCLLLQNLMVPCPSAVHFAVPFFRAGGPAASRQLLRPPPCTNTNINIWFPILLLRAAAALPSSTLHTTSSSTRLSVPHFDGGSLVVIGCAGELCVGWVYVLNIVSRLSAYASTQPHAYAYDGAAQLS